MNRGTFSIITLVALGFIFLDRSDVSGVPANSNKVLPHLSRANIDASSRTFQRAPVTKGKQPGPTHKQGPTRARARSDNAANTKSTLEQRTGKAKVDNRVQNSDVNKFLKDETKTLNGFDAR